MTDLETCRLIDLPMIEDFEKGRLSVAEEFLHVPFDIKRVYWTYSVSKGESRGGHAHKALYQFLVAVSGSFEVVLDNGNRKKMVLLDTPWKGLLITPGIWCTLENYSQGSVCMCLASELYDEDDYIREYDDFIQVVTEK